MSADLDTLRAADAGNLTFLHGLCAFLAVRASHIDSHSTRTFIAQLDDGAWTRLDTYATAHTLILDHLRKTGLEVHLHRAVRTGLHTIATTETSVGTGGLSCAERCHD